MNFLFKLSLIPSSIGGIVLLYKTYYGVPMYTGSEDLKDKVAVVTGGTSGIGKEIAYQLAKRNATLILAARNSTDCKAVRTKIYQKTKNSNIYCSELDLSSFDSVRLFVGRLKSRMPKVDIVVHSAGVKEGKIRKVSSDNIEQQMAVNVMATYLLNKLLQPLLSKDSRNVTLVCPQYSAGSINTADLNSTNIYDGKGAFAQSQLMRVMLARNWPPSVAVTVDPGPTNSDFHRQEAYNGNIVSRVIFRGLNLLLLRNVWQAASTPIMCVCAPSVVHGAHYRDLEIIPLEAVALDPQMGEYARLLCEKWTARRPADVVASS